MTTDTPVTAPRNAGTTGRISLVGIGPGHTDHMTARARAAIAEADVVVGYVTYIKLVADLLDGKEVVRKGMTEELDRAVLLDGQDDFERVHFGRPGGVHARDDRGQAQGHVEEGEEREGRHRDPARLDAEVLAQHCRLVGEDGARVHRALRSARAARGE